MKDKIKARLKLLEEVTPYGPQQDEPWFLKNIINCSDDCDSHFDVTTKDKEFYLSANEFETDLIKAYEQLKSDHTALQRKHEGALSTMSQMQTMIDGNHLEREELAMGMIRLNGKLQRIASLCGNPDASEACRLILKEIQE